MDQRDRTQQSRAEVSATQWLSGELTRASTGEIQEGSTMARLAGELYDAIISSGRFSWMGLFQVRDELGLLNLILVLEMSTSPSGATSTQEKTAFLPIFAELSVALRPFIFLALYYTAPIGETERTSTLLADLGHRFGQAEPRLFLRWEHSIACSAPV